ncbi:hypothetical protein ABT354_23230 [Streptomyces sp. NPDC000594]|uniref:hypothetical protein n=1 Tax=Streptomyces sp. NPDC000594 TaxID=3154261 RepID=UPI00332A4CB2
MDLARSEAESVLTEVENLGLINAAERAEVLSTMDADFPFAEAVRHTDSVHAHIKVDDVDTLPHQELAVLGYRPENAEPGYIKYSTDAGVHFIFSSIPIAQDDGIRGAVTLAKPFLDHVGVDMRDEAPATREAFDAVVGRAVELGWREVTQSGPVHCCHTQVQEKHWTYPPADWPGRRRPIEFAFGSLRIFDKVMGCDLRPIDPAHELAPPEPGCCGSAQPGGPDGTPGEDC